MAQVYARVFSCTLVTCFFRLPREEKVWRQRAHSNRIDVRRCFDELAAGSVVAETVSVLLLSRNSMSVFFLPFIEVVVDAVVGTCEVACGGRVGVART